MKEIIGERRWSERHICEALELSRSTQRYTRAEKNEEQLVERIVFLALKHIRYGYRRILALLKDEGTVINYKKLERLWQETGLKIRKKKKKYRRIIGQHLRLRALRKNHVWSYDLVSGKLLRGGKYRILLVIDEYSRECLGVLVKRSIKAENVEGLLAKLFLEKGRPEYIRSDKGAEFTAKALMNWLKQINVNTLFIEPGSPWQNGYCESFNGKMRDECLNVEACGTIVEADYVIGNWVNDYNTIRPHSSLGYKPPAPEAVLPTLFNKVNLCLSLN